MELDRVDVTGPITYMLQKSMFGSKVGKTPPQRR